MPTPTPERVTVALDPTLFAALQAGAAVADISVSDLVNDAVRALLAEDADDLAALDVRASEQPMSVEQFARDLRAEGAI